MLFILQNKGLTALKIDKYFWINFRSSVSGTNLNITLVPLQNSYTLLPSRWAILPLNPCISLTDYLWLMFSRSFIKVINHSLYGFTCTINTSKMLTGKQNPNVVLSHFCTVLIISSMARYSWKTSFVYTKLNNSILYLAEPSKFNRGFIIFFF